MNILITLPYDIYEQYYDDSLLVMFKQKGFKVYIEKLVNVWLVSIVLSTRDTRSSAIAEYDAYIVHKYRVTEREDSGLYAQSVFEVSGTEITGLTLYECVLRCMKYLEPSINASNIESTEIAGSGEGAVKRSSYRIIKLG